MGAYLGHYSTMLLIMNDHSKLTQLSLCMNIASESRGSEDNNNKFLVLVNFIDYHQWLLIVLPVL
jgi:hypothetical protein